MTKNLIPTIAKMLGVELDEKFTISGCGGTTYKFDNNGLKGTCDIYDNRVNMSANNALLVELLNGERKIIKLPWKPQYNQPYWTFCWIASKNRLDVWQNVWMNSFEDVALLKAGWVFRSRKEAEAALPDAAKDFRRQLGLNLQRRHSH